MNVKFYTTLGCHLCEDALQLLKNITEEGHHLETELVEISDSDELMRRYGIRIPVVARNSDNAELGWPFNQEQLFCFLAENK